MLYFSHVIEKSFSHNELINAVANDITPVESTARIPIKDFTQPRTSPSVKSVFISETTVGSRFTLVIYSLFF